MGQQAQDAGTIILLRLLRKICLLRLLLLLLLRLPLLLFCFCRCRRQLPLPPLPPALQCIEQLGGDVDRLCTGRVHLACRRLRDGGAVYDCKQLAAACGEAC